MTGYVSRMSEERQEQQETPTFRLQLTKHMLQIIALHQKRSLIIRATGAGLAAECWKLPGSAIKAPSSPPADKFHLSGLHLTPLELVVWEVWPSFLLCENRTRQHKPALALWDFGAPQETAHRSVCGRRPNQPHSHTHTCSLALPMSDCLRLNQIDSDQNPAGVFGPPRWLTVRGSINEGWGWLWVLKSAWKRCFPSEEKAFVPEPVRELNFASPLKCNQHPQVSNYRFIAKEENKYERYLKTKLRSL